MIDFTGKTDKEIIKIVLRLHEWMVNDRRDYEALWELENKLFLPRRRDMLKRGRGITKGKQYGARIFDGHPANAANKFALGMLAHMMSRSVPWIQFITSDVKLMKNDDVKKYVQGAAEQILFGLNESDIYGQSVWAVKDGTVTGTAFNIPEENVKAGKMHYGTVSPKDSYIKFDRFGNIVAYHKPIKMSAIEALSQFDESKLPAGLIRDAKAKGSGNPFKQYEFLYAIYANPTPQFGSMRSQDKPFKVFYILIKGGQRGANKLVLNSGTRFGPSVWPYGREADENYGTSLAADALTEGLQANKLGQLKLTVAHRAADPPTEAWTGLREKGIQSNPGGRNWVSKDFAGRAAIREIFTNNAWPIDDAQSQRLAATIDDKFFVPLWDALLTLEGPQRTLGEVLQIQGNKAVLLSPVSESFEEYLKTIVNNQWIFEEQIAGRMPEVPDILLDPKNRKIETVFIGPLPQLQRATIQTRGTVNALAVIGQIGTIWENALIKINEMELMEDAAISQGMKQTLIRTDQEVREILEKKAADAEAARQSELINQGADTANKLGNVLELAGAGVG